MSNGLKTKQLQTLVVALTYNESLRSLKHKVVIV